MRPILNVQQQTPERELTDHVLLAHSRSDPEAFAEFYRRHIDRVIGFAVRRVATPGDVADVVAATFLAALESAGSYDPRRGEPMPWLLGIAARLIANQRRRRAREGFAYARLEGRSLLDSDDIERLESRIDAAAQADLARSALAWLPATQREALLLVGEEGLSPAEAARVLGISGTAFRVRLVRARRAIRTALDHTPEDPATITEDIT
jgi:RNA polymerase sigma factor (sigma-70 family)